MSKVPKLAYTAVELAERLEVSTDTVRRRAQAGLIPHVRIGSTYRFPVVVIDRWLQEQAAASLAPSDEQLLSRLLQGVS